MNAPEIIAAKAFGMEQHYMRDLPIHHSQKEIKATDSYTDYEVYIRPTTDFKAHLMSRGGWLQVISPRSLAKEILKWHQEAIDIYTIMQIRLDLLQSDISLLNLPGVITSPVQHSSAITSAAIQESVPCNTVINKVDRLRPSLA